MNLAGDRVRAVLVGFAFFCAAGGMAACSPSSPEPGAEVAVGTLELSDGWAAATPNGANVGAGYLNIVNDSDASDALVSVTSPRAPRVELHEMAMDGAVMRMRRVERLEAPAHETVALAPGGYHLMFMDLPAPFVAGESVPVTLTFEHAGAMEIELPVRSHQAAAGGGMSHDR